MDRLVNTASLDREIWADLQALYADDPGALDELIPIYLGEAALQVDLLYAALAAADPAGLRRAAHALRGSSASMGFAPLVDLAARLEVCSQAADLLAAAELVRAVAAAYTQVRRALSPHAPHVVDARR